VQGPPKNAARWSKLRVTHHLERQIKRYQRPIEQTQIDVFLRYDNHMVALRVHIGLTFFKSNNDYNNDMPIRDEVT